VPDIVVDVFISYARSDARRVRLIAEGLHHEGFKVWWDPKIKPGKKWHKEIKAALERAAAVVTVWSPAATASKFVLAETHAAQDQHKLFPVQIKACEPPVPFNMVEAADLADWTGDADDPEWTALLRQVRSTVDRRGPVPAAVGATDAQGAIGLFNPSRGSNVLLQAGAGVAGLAVVATVVATAILGSGPRPQAAPDPAPTAIAPQPSESAAPPPAEPPAPKAQPPAFKAQPKVAPKPTTAPTEARATPEAGRIIANAVAQCYVNALYPVSIEGGARKVLGRIRSCPARDALSQYYPRPALDRYQEATVVLGCTIVQEGALACNAVNEDPPGWEFGKAAIKVARELRFSTESAEGENIVGGTVQLPIKFKIKN
jgi:TonB family protein